MAAGTAASEGVTERIALDITGMTCASCATRIERKLNRLDGVTATVNYATEQASVEYPGTLSAQDLVAVVEAAGYQATVPAPRIAPDAVGLEQSAAAESEGDQPADSAAQAAAAVLRRLTISAALALPVLLMAMVPA